MRNRQSSLFSSRASKRATFSVSLLMWAAAAATPSIASASILFTNFGPGQSYDVASGNIVGNGFDGNNYAQGDTFVAKETQRFLSMSLALSCFFGCPADFAISLNADTSGVPGTAIESFNVAGGILGVFGNSNPPVQVISVLKPLLTVGTRYWVTVSSPIDNSIEWNFNSTGDPSNEAISTDGAATWFAPSGLTPGALEVDATPEPGSLLLVGTFLSGLVLRKRL